jgi:chemotaxis protein CheD
MMTHIIAEHFLFPATVFGNTTPHLVQTILGSCVSICLFDQVLHQGAVNHFMLPWWNGNELPTPKYGDIAFERLLEKMYMMGSRRENLVAKIFGGADQHDLGKNGYVVGARNITTAEKQLAKEHIRIIAQSTGGMQGRKIIFHTQTNQVLMKYLSNNGSK